MVTSAGTADPSWDPAIQQGWSEAAKVSHVLSCWNNLDGIESLPLETEGAVEEGVMVFCSVRQNRLTAAHGGRR